MTIGTYALTMDRVNVMAYSQSYMKHAFIFAYAESTQLVTPLARLMAPFQGYVWLSIALLLAISVLVILLTKNLPKSQRHFIIGGRMNRTPILNMINAIIGNVISNPRMSHKMYFGTFARTLLILWIFLWLIIRNSYQGSMYEYLQSQRAQSPYDTVEKVRTSNVKINIISTAIELVPEGFKR